MFIVRIIQNAKINCVGKMQMRFILNEMMRIVNSALEIVSERS
jgi:hypothetical protein